MILSTQIHKHPQAGSANFWKGTDSKDFRLCSPHSFCCNYRICQRMEKSRLLLPLRVPSPGARHCAGPLPEGPTESWSITTLLWAISFLSTTRGSLWLSTEKPWKEEPGAPHSEAPPWREPPHPAALTCGWQLSGEARRRAEAEASGGRLSSSSLRPRRGCAWRAGRGWRRPPGRCTCCWHLRLRSWPPRLRTRIASAAPSRSPLASSWWPGQCQTQHRSLEAPAATPAISLCLSPNTWVPMQAQIRVSM